MNIKALVVFSTILISTSQYTHAANTALNKGAADEMSFHTGGTVNASRTTTGDFGVKGNITAAEPTAANHVATKNYVDNNSGGETCSLATNGWCDNPSGKEERWGYGTVSTDDAVTVTFAKAFTTACLNIQFTRLGAGGTYSLHPVTTCTQTSFTIDRDNNFSGSNDYYYRALGH